MGETTGWVLVTRHDALYFSLYVAKEYHRIVSFYDVHYYT